MDILRAQFVHYHGCHPGIVCIGLADENLVQVVLAACCRMPRENPHVDWRMNAERASGKGAITDRWIWSGIGQADNTCTLHCLAAMHICVNQSR